MRLYLFAAVLPALIQAKSLATNLAKDSQCSFANDALNVSWTFDAPSSDVVFKMVAQSRSRDFWAGLFLGNDRPEDSIGAFVRNGQIGVIDGYVADDRLLLDNMTNLQSLLFDLQDYKLTAEFARPLTTSDKGDADLSQCITFFFPSQPLDIDPAGQIQVPKDLESKRVCNIPTSCKTESIDVVKRSDATVCEHTQGTNIIRWQKVDDEVKFSIGQSVQPGKWWSAIGVGQGMADLKIAAAFFENGEVKNLGGYHAEGHGVPAADDSLTPKLDAENSKMVDGRSVVQFSLPMDLFTSRFDDSGCVTLQIASEAGEWDDDYVFKKHQNTPEAILVCGIDQCSATLETAGAEAAGAEAGAGAEAVTGATVAAGAEAVSGATAAATGAEAVSGATPAATGAEAVSGATPAAAGAEAVSGATPAAGEAEAVSGATAEPGAAGAVSGATTQQPESNEVTAASEAAASGATAIAAQAASGATAIAAQAASGATTSVPQGATATAEANAVGEGATASGATPASEAHEGSATEATAAGSGSEHTAAPGVQTSTVEGISGVVIGASARPEAEGSGEATNDTSLFASAAHAVEELPEGSGTEGSGELAKVEVHGTEALNTITGTGAAAEEGSGEGAAKVTSAPGEASGSTPVPSAVPVEGSGEMAVGGEGAKVTGTETEGKPLVLAKADEPTVVNVLKNGCADDHTDIHVCEQYFEDYLGKVKAWADKHDQVLEKNMWKACKLLSQVKHVPTLCCSKFYSTCSIHMETRR